MKRRKMLAELARAITDEVERNPDFAQRVAAALCGDHESRCMIPRFDGAILSLAWKEALWDRYATAAPRPGRPSELRYSVAGFDRGAELRAGHQRQDSGEVARPRERGGSQDRAEAAALERA